MKETPRSLAVAILNRVDRAGLFAEPLLDRCLSRNILVNDRDRRLLTEIVYGTLRMRGRIDGIIARLYRGDMGAMETGVKNILRTALYQLLYMDRIPGFAVVDEAVKIAKRSHPAGSGLINAVLRNAIRRKGAASDPGLSEDPEAHISQVHSHPSWLVKRWIGLFGVEGALALCRANNGIPPLTVRVNRLKASRAKVLEDLVRDGFDAQETAFSAEGIVLSGHGAALRETESWREGRIQIQDEASQLISVLVDPQPGERILDACAGVGVKASHLAERMGNRGSIAALDISGEKLKALNGNMKRLGVGIVKTAVRDLTEKRDDPKEGGFDRVLLDVPCSGLGTLRRNPEIKWRVAPAEVERNASLQGRLLERAADLLKPGGILVYSTCTILPEENEGVIAAFLSRRGDYRLAGLPESIPPEMQSAEGFFKTRTDLHGTDGFFGAILLRRT